MKKRGLVIGLLVMLAVITSGFTYAFWASLDNDEVAAGTISIGSGRVTTVTADLGTIDVSLVPVGQVNNSNQDNAASSVELVYTLDYTDSAEFASTAAYSVVLSNYVLGTVSETRILELFTFDVTADLSITKDVPETVSVLVTFLLEPADATEYGLIASGTLSFDVTFTVVPVVNP
ncbi:MAG: hypothetical protein KKH92_03495 [Firmicutes bacterium]|nr:hypothetical protein [Bacillota bacterium]